MPKITVRHLENIQSQRACDALQERNTKYTQQSWIVTSVSSRFSVFYLICDRIPNSGKANNENFSLARI